MRHYDCILERYTELISIHAPLTGCDIVRQCGKLHISYFNPRTPYGMRLTVFTHCSNFQKFQSTHPLRDATEVKAVREVPRNNFNPRTPYGMRLILSTKLDNFCLFQSTHPLRDATRLACMHIY